MTDEELENLLPWYVNGTLSPEERKAVEDLLARSEQARNELAFLQKLSAQVKSEPATPVSELGWRRLQRDIQKESGPEKRSWWKPGFAVAASLILALQVGILVQGPESDTNTRLLEKRAVPEVAVGTAWQLQIEFRDDSDWSEITSLLNQVEGTIISGPSALGLLRISVPRNNSQHQSPEALVTWLQQQPQVSHAALEGD